MKRHFKDWIHTYVYHMSEDTHNDASELFNRWTALSILSAVLGGCGTTIGGHRVHPNLYVMLIGSPNMRKGKAVNTGLDLLEKCKLLTHPYLFQPELARIFQGYEFDQIRELLRDYDEGIHTVLGGITSQALQRCLQRELMFSLPGRFIPVYTEERVFKVSAACLYAETQEQKDRRVRLKEDLIEISKASGAFIQTEGWVQTYKEWYGSDSNLIVKDQSPWIDSYNARLGQTLIKLSMLLSISQGCRMLLEQSHFEGAVSLLREVNNNLQLLLKGFSK